MTKCHVYHGTVAGKDDIFLESFIVTGALSGKTERPQHQEGGFYVSLEQSGLAYAFSHTMEQADAEERYGLGTMRYGRGIIVECEVELDAEHWNFDHEWQDASMRVIKKFRDELPSLTFHAKGSALKNIPTQKPFFIEAGEDDGKNILCYKDISGKDRNVLMVFGDFCHLEIYPSTFFLEQIHLTLKENFQKCICVKSKKSLTG